METPFFFQKKYAWINNVGHPVGVDADNVLMLDRNYDTDGWDLLPIHYSEIQNISVRQYRSLYVLMIAVISAVAALIVAYLGITLQTVGFGIFTIPPFLGIVSYLAFTGSKRLRLEFDALSKRLVYKSQPGFFGETLAVLPNLRDWADAHNIRTDIDSSIELGESV